MVWTEHEATLQRKLADLQQELENRLAEMKQQHEDNVRLMMLQHQETITRTEAGQHLCLVPAIAAR